MAHLTQRIPWELLAGHFKFVYQNHRYEYRTNLYPCNKDNQGKELNHFSKVFARLLDEFSLQERAKYPTNLVPPADNELILTETIIQKIAETVKRYKTAQPLRHSDGSIPTSILPDERYIPYWLTNLQHASSTLWASSKSAHIMGLFSTLLLYGEMEPLLRLAAHADVKRYLNTNFVHGHPCVYGWSSIKDLALASYICLNVLLLKPELHDGPTRDKRLDDMKKRGEKTPTKEQFNYRYTYAYQSVLTKNNSDLGAEVCTYPHQQFFGAVPGMFSHSSWWDRNACGKRRPQDLCHGGFKIHLPHKNDIPLVINMLGKKGLPAELALHVMELADYTPKRKLLIPNDPLHPENRVELRRYLRYCWDLLLRTDFMLKEIGTWIDWEYEVNQTIFTLFGVSYPEMSKTIPEFEYEGRYEYEVEAPRLRRTFV